MGIEIKNSKDNSADLSTVPLKVIEDLYKDKSGQDPLVAEKETQEEVIRVLHTDVETAKAPSVLVFQPKAKQLREIAGSFFMGPDELWEIYKKLNIEIPPEEIKTVEEIYGRLLLGPGYDKVRAHAQTFKHNSEGKMNPIIMGPRPEAFLERIDGSKTKDRKAKVWWRQNNIDTNSRYINQGNTGLNVSLPHPSNFSFTVKRTLEQQYGQSWDYSLSVWTSSVLQCTKGKWYSSQVKMQDDLASEKGENSFAIGHDAFFPFTYAHILNGFSPIPSGTEIRTNSGYGTFLGRRAEIEERFNYAFGLKEGNTLNVYFFDTDNYGNGKPGLWSVMHKDSGIGAAYHYKFSP